MPLNLTFFRLIPGEQCKIRLYLNSIRSRQHLAQAFWTNSVLLDLDRRPYDKWLIPAQSTVPVLVGFEDAPAVQTVKSRLLGEDKFPVHIWCYSSSSFLLRCLDLDTKKKKASFSHALQKTLFIENHLILPIHAFSNSSLNSTMPFLGNTPQVQVDNLFMRWVLVLYPRCDRTYTADHHSQIWVVSLPTRQGGCDSTGECRIRRIKGRDAKLPTLDSSWGTWK